MYEVYKHPAPFNGKDWAVKMPHGIECYKTKRKATEVRDEAIRLLDGDGQGDDSDDQTSPFYEGHRKDQESIPKFFKGAV